MAKRELGKLFLPLALALLAAGSACSSGSQGGGSAGAKGDADKGKTLYEATCVGCHGQDAKGVTGLGKDLTTSTFVKGLSDSQFVDFLKKGRPASDPANTTKIDMPPKGGNPALTDAQLLDIAAFIRSLNH